jgi:hypothetical protein
MMMIQGNGWKDDEEGQANTGLHGARARRPHEDGKDNNEDNHQGEDE